VATLQHKTSRMHVKYHSVLLLRL